MICRRSTFVAHNQKLELRSQDPIPSTSQPWHLDSKVEVVHHHYLNFMKFKFEQSNLWFYNYNSQFTKFFRFWKDLNITNLDSQQEWQLND